MVENSNKVVSRIFFAITFIASCFTMNSDNLGGYLYSQGNYVIILRFVLIAIFLSIATLICKNDLKFIYTFTPIATVITTVLLIFDYYVTQFSGSQFLFKVWWIAYIFGTECVLFVVISLFKDKEYKKFYYNFWYGFTPIYLFLLYLCFVRTPFDNNLSVNMELGNGTFLMLKSFINNPSGDFEAPLLFFGNLIIFVPLSFILSAFIKKINPVVIVIIGIILPIIIEGYQYIFQCGDTDIDDLILNWSGFIIGFVLYLINKKRHKINRQT